MLSSIALALIINTSPIQSNEAVTAPVENSEVIYIQTTTETSSSSSRKRSRK